jgi:hypothetical protein
VGVGGREWARAGETAQRSCLYRTHVQGKGFSHWASNACVQHQSCPCKKFLGATQDAGKQGAPERVLPILRGSRINMLHERLQIPQRGFAKERYLEHLLRKDVFVCICHPNAYHATLLLIPLPKHLRFTSRCRGNIWKGSSDGNLGELEGSPLRRRSAIYFRHFPYV